MSWIFGVSESGRNGNIENSPDHGRTLFRLNRPGLVLEAGGNPRTCFFESSANGESGWIVVGTGIRSENSHGAIMTATDWGAQIEKLPSAVERTDGHFVALRWKGNKLECFTDQLGLRSFYFAGIDGATVFSTRLDWVAQSTGRNSVDMSSLGSAWLLFNQIGYESLVSGIERLGPGGDAVFEKGTLKTSKTRPWFSANVGRPPGGAMAVLPPIIDAAFSTPDIPSLGLSGGLDSRLMLALLKDYGKEFITHNFGNAGDPDSYVPSRIARDFGVEHNHLDIPLPDVRECIALGRSYVARTFLTEPFTTMMRLRNVSLLGEAGRLMVDGGYGEMARRVFLNRIVRSGQSTITARDIPRLTALTRSHRSDIFNQDVIKDLESNAGVSIGKAIDSMPAVEKYRIGNFVDLFSIRYRIPNQAGPEQALLDEVVRNYMPLAQPSFLRAVLATPVRERVRSAIYKSFIRKTYPKLTRYPLVKSGMTYPFRLSGEYSWLFMKLKAKTGKRFHDPSPDRILGHIKEYVLDLVHSRSVREYELYDAKKIAGSVEGYYRGNTGLSSEVDWWLSFELWRQSLDPAIVQN